MKNRKTLTALAIGVALGCFGLLPNEITVDCFAGGGGASTGIEQAIGKPVDIAINHDLDAIRMHEMNHPFTQHYHEDIRDVDPIVVCGGRPVGAAWFSPDCKHFTKARGCAPVDKKIRGLAWTVIRWAGAVQMRTFYLENVEEFQDWCPTITVEKKVKGETKLVDIPDPERLGETFTAFIECLTTGLSHNTAPDILAEIKAEVAELLAQHEVFSPRAEVVDTDDSSIKAISWITKYRNTNIGSAMDEPLPTVTAGGLHLGLTTAFIVKYYGSNVGSAITDPLHTVTTKHRFGLVTVHGDQYRIIDIQLRMLNSIELFLAMGFPADYLITHDQDGKYIPETKRIARVGNAVVPLMAKLLIEANLYQESI